MREPNTQTLHPKPSDEEVLRREVTHLPYAPWCEACVAGKGRPDAHKTDVSSKDRAIPCVSMDFCYTGKKIEPLTPDERVLPPDHKRLICLMLFDLQTGSTAAFPVQKKVYVRFLCAEVCRFLNFLGHNEIEVRTDNEPVLLSLQKAIQKARNKMGSQTHITTTKPLDHGSNSWVESCVHRVRQMALVLVREMS